MDGQEVLKVTEGLTATYEPEGTQNLGELHVAAYVAPFAGAAVGYFDDSELSEWTNALRAYPWEKDARFEISAAIGNQATVNLCAFVITGRGQLGDSSSS